MFIFATRSRTFMVVLQVQLFLVHAKVSIMAEVTWRMGHVFMTIVSSMRSRILLNFWTVSRVFMSMFCVVVMVVMMVMMMMMIFGGFISIMIVMLMLLFVWWNFTIVILMVVMMIVMMLNLIFRSRSLSRRRFSVFI